MSGFSLTVSSDLSGLERRLGSDALRRYQAALGQRVGRDSNTFVMYDTGDTSRSMGVSTAGDEVSWSTPYASAAYHSSHARTAVNPQAHTHWFDYAKSVRMQDWVDFVGGLFS